MKAAALSIATYPFRHVLHHPGHRYTQDQDGEDFAKLYEHARDVDDTFHSKPAKLIELLAVFIGCTATALQSAFIGLSLYP